VLIALVGLIGFVAYGTWLMVTEGRDKQRVLSALDGQVVTLGLGRGPYAGSTATRGRLVLDDSKRRITFVEEVPKFQKGTFGVRDPAQGELLRLGQIRWVADAEGRRLGGPWTKLRIGRHGTDRRPR